MTESLANFFVNLFGSLNGNIIIFLISLLPILELRGGLIAASLLNLPFTSSFIICLIGNILPIPFILLFLEKIFAILKKSPKIASILNKLEAKSLAKSKDITKYKYIYLGLFLFVAIPLPGTGGWTGALLAILLGLNRKKSFIAITLGIITAGIIMSILSYGILGNIIN